MTLQIITFDERIRAIDINDEIRKNKSAIPVRVKFNKGQKNVEGSASRTYYIAGSVVDFTIEPLFERILK
jgi:hypothetical protein